MAAHKILKATPDGRPWSNDYGTFQTYSLKLEGVDEPVDLNQKVTTNPPVEGSVIDVDLSPHPRFDGRLKAKKAQGGGGFGGGGGGMPPEERAKIQRQHSQKVALMYVQAKAAVGAIPADFKPADLVPIIDFFEKDISNAVALRGGS